MTVLAEYKEQGKGWSELSKNEKIKYGLFIMSLTLITKLFGLVGLGITCGLIYVAEKAYLSWKAKPLLNEKED